VSAEPSQASQATLPRIPDFFIVGHAKSGTTALYEMLRGHPQLFMPDLKEPWFFASDMRPRLQRPRAGVPPKTLEEYRTLFGAARDEQRIGEGTSSYLWSRTAAKAIFEVQPQAQIIAILREPADFLRSLHLQFLRSHIESERDLRKAIALEGARREGRHIPRQSDRPQLLQYLDHVRYVEQLRRYEALFTRERMLVLIYDDFNRDNEAAICDVLRFLGVDETYPIALKQVNPSLGMRSQQLDDLVHAVSVGSGPVTGAARSFVKALAPRRLRHRALGATRRHIVYGAPREPDEALMLELRQRFKGEVESLSNYLDRDLVTLWGYDKLG
jgi:hypothetical protein